MLDEDDESSDEDDLMANARKNYLKESVMAFKRKAQTLTDVKQTSLSLKDNKESLGMIDQATQALF